MADIFISYLREDIEAAEKLAEALEVHGWSVFWDPRIPAGKRFDDFLDDQLQAARCVIVLWSRGSIHSPWVRDEAAVGRDRGILVPARLGDVPAPFGFRAIQAANLIGREGDPSHWGFQQLLRDIRATIEVPASVVLAGMGESRPRVSQEQEAEAKRRAAEEERQRRQQEEAEAKRRAAEEERQRRQQQEEEAASAARRFARGGATQIGGKIITIKVGDKLPSVKLMRWGEGGPEAVTTDDLFRGKTVALFGVPGAFTPTCSAKHLPGFVQQADALNAKGVDAIVCMSVNDVFVMNAWGNEQKCAEKVTMVADGDAAFTKATGLELDLGGKGLGLRNQRFSMLVDDGTVKILNIDPVGAFDKTSAETLLSQI